MSSLIHGILHVLLRLAEFMPFVVGYCAWAWLGLKLQRRLGAHLLEWHPFAGQLYILLSIGGLFLFLLLLSGFIDIYLIALLVAAQEIALVVAAALASFVGKPGPEEIAHGLLLRYEGSQNRGVTGVSSAFAVVVMMYPLIAAILFFSFHGASLKTHLFQATILLMIGSYCIYLVQLPLWLAHPNMDIEDRKRSVAGALGSLIPLFLLLSIAYWTFGSQQAGYALGTVSSTDSWVVVGGLVFIFVATVLVPVQIGIRRGQRFDVDSLESQRDHLRSLVRILELPMGQSYGERLDSLRQTVRTEVEGHSAINPFSDLEEELQDELEVDGADEVNVGDEPSSNGVAERRVGDVEDDASAPGTGDDTVSVKSFRSARATAFIAGLGLSRRLDKETLLAAFEKAQGSDPRFKRVEWLRGFEQEIASVQGELRRRRSVAGREAAAAAWARAYRSQIDEQDDEILAAKKRKSPAWLRVGAVMTPISSVILSEAGKSVWSAFAKKVAP